MRVNAFLDTNIIVYAVSSAGTTKQAVARDLVSNRRYWISPQVLLEATSVLTKKNGFSASEASRVLVGGLALQIVPATAAIVEHAWRIADRYKIGIYDAAIIASALAAKCTVVYSEDFQDGQRFESLAIKNPFA